LRHTPARRGVLTFVGCLIMVGLLLWMYTNTTHTRPSPAARIHGHYIRAGKGTDTQEPGTRNGTISPTIEEAKASSTTGYPGGGGSNRGGGRRHHGCGERRACPSTLGCPRAVAKTSEATVEATGTGHQRRGECKHSSDSSCRRH
jgi:hypothetical protein